MSQVSGLRSQVSGLRYYTLSREEQLELANFIAKDNLEKSNSKYKVPQVKKTFYVTFFKRIIDILVSAIALTVSFPLNIIFAIITFFDVGRPIFFVQERIGKNGKPFTIFKFRNMTNETDENGRLLPPYVRVTKWGKFMRSTSLDELLNFFNIFIGDMSLIGPRPLPLIYKGRFNRFHEARFFVRPGLDCPLIDTTKSRTWQNRLDNDVWYAENCSFFTDIKMVILLIRETFLEIDKDRRSASSVSGAFMGYDKEGKVMDSLSIPETYFDKISCMEKH